MSTPMMKQYRELTAQLPAGTLLLLRLGDFYEAFFDNARPVAQALQLSLTKRMDIPMAGFPYHQLEQAIQTLVKAGHSVALAEMTTEPNPRRVITREASPAAPPVPARQIQTDLFNP